MKANKQTAKIFLTGTLILVLILVMSFTSNASSLPANISRSLDNIAGKSANLIYIKTGNGRTGEITIGSGKFYTVDTAQNHLNRKNRESGKSVSVAINGGYFDAYSDSYKTYANIIQNGVQINGGVKKSIPTLGFTSTGEALIDRVGIETKVVLRNETKVVPWYINSWSDDPSAVMLFNSYMGKAIDIPATSAIVYISGNMVTEVTNGTSKSLNQIPANTYVLVYNENAYNNAKKYGTDPKIGNSAEIITVIEPSQEKNKNKWTDIVNAVSAGPMILIDGKDVSEQNPEFIEVKQGPNYIALRSFAAIMNDGRLLLGTATASPKQLAAYLLSKGAVDAMSLDGGASTMLYVKNDGFLVSAGRKLSNVLNIVDYKSGVLPTVHKNDLQTPSSWAESDINTARSLDLIPENVDKGYKTNITRQEFCNLTMKLLTAVLGESEVNVRLVRSGISYDEARSTFTDAYHIDVLSCYRMNIVGGIGNGLFNPNGSITRQEAAKILTRICEITGIEANNPALSFSDEDKIASWAKDYVRYISSAGIMNGSKGAFNPLGYYSRQEAVVTMLRIYNQVKKQP